MTRNRTVKIKAQNNGTECTGDTEDVESCKDDKHVAQTSHLISLIIDYKRVEIQVLTHFFRFRYNPMHTRLFT